MKDEKVCKRNYSNGRIAFLSSLQISFISVRKSCFFDSWMPTIAYVYGCNLHKSTCGDVIVQTQ
ncbi:MAG: hypothetical protein LBJ89_03200 [Holosporales bacterium]|nr:hypothetical protein [Holosporales bacterium]